MTLKDQDCGVVFALRLNVRKGVTLRCNQVCFLRLWNSEYSVYAVNVPVLVQNHCVRTHFRKPQFMWGSKRGNACLCAFWKMPHWRQCCIVSDERTQCHSYNYDSRGKLFSLNKLFYLNVGLTWKKSALLAQPPEVRGIITLSSLYMLSRPCRAVVCVWKLTPANSSTFL